MGIIFYLALGVVVGLLWHVTMKSRGVLHPFADGCLGGAGGVAGSLLAGFFEAQQRFFVVWPGGVALALGTALCALWTARAVSQIPVDA